MVTVGVIAALINVVVLVIATFADRAVECIARNFAVSRLFRRHQAPVVHDSDTWLPNFPRSVVKYRKNPGMFLPVHLGPLKFYL